MLGRPWRQGRAARNHSQRATVYACCQPLTCPSGYWLTLALSRPNHLIYHGMGRCPASTRGTWSIPGHSLESKASVACLLTCCHGCHRRATGPRSIAWTLFRLRYAPERLACAYLTFSPIPERPHDHICYPSHDDDTGVLPRYILTYAKAPGRPQWGDVHSLAN